MKVQSHIKILLYISAFLGAQRFLLQEISVYLCVVPLIFSFKYFKRDKVLRNSLLLLALFLSVDNGGAVYNITNSIVRYTIYIVSAYALTEGIKLSRKNCFIFVSLITVPVILSIYNYEHIDTNTLERDLLLSILTSTIICKSDLSAPFQIRIDLISNFLIIFLLAELLNIFVFSSAWDRREYLNYNSTKSLVVLPTFYYLSKGNLKKTILLFFLTIPVLIAYATRMIIVTYVLIIAVNLIRYWVLKPTNVTIIILLFIGINQLTKHNNFEFEGYKATAVFVEILREGDLLDKIKAIDPVRYVETSLFFDRNVFNILFGSGFGSGLHDINNDFFFVNDTDTAFSQKELREGYFYNLHDSWVDIGLRFGLIFICIAYFIVIKNVNSFKVNKSTLAKTLFVLISCAFFSSQGLLIIFFVFHSYLNKVRHNNPLKMRSSLKSPHRNILLLNR